MIYIKYIKTQHKMESMFSLSFSLVAVNESAGT